MWGLHFDICKVAKGCILARNVEDLGLLKGDRLDPSPELRDVGKFEETVLPVLVIFWRAHKDNDGKLLDGTLRRNPLFDREVGITPATTLMVDTLHTLYLGVYQRYVMHVIWHALDSNLWHVEAAQSTKDELGRKHLVNDLKGWYVRNNVPQNYRINDITDKLIGTRKAPDLKTKAGETGVLVRWATDLCQRHARSMKLGDELLAAGECLLEYMAILKEHDRIVPRSACQRLLDLCTRHISLLQLAQLPLVPKHHLMVHLTLRIPTRGNPRFYSTFLDESLNAALAKIAGASHRTTWETSIFSRVRLLPHVQPHSAFAIA